MQKEQEGVRSDWGKMEFPPPHPQDGSLRRRETHLGPEDSTVQHAGSLIIEKVKFQRAQGSCRKRVRKERRRWYESLVQVKM